MLAQTFITFILTALFGFMWYSTNIGFGKQWMHYTGVKPESTENTAKVMALGMMLNLLTVLSIGFLVKWLDIISLPAALTFTGVAGLGLAVGVTATNFCWEQRPFNLFLIYVGHTFGVVLISTLVYTYFN